MDKITVKDLEVWRAAVERREEHCNLFKKEVK